MNVDDYFRQTAYDGVAEITKENQLNEFFRQKYQRVNNYLDHVDRESEKAAKKARSSIRNYGTKLKFEQTMLQRQGDQEPRASIKRNSTIDALRSPDDRLLEDDSKVLSPDLSVVYGGIKKTEDASVGSLNVVHD